MRARLLPEAREELDRSALRYELERTGRGIRLLRRVDRALDLLEEYPAAGQLWEEAATVEPVRRLPIRRFPFGLIYVESLLLVIAVAHDRQAPGYWADRLDPPGTSSNSG